GGGRAHAGRGGRRRADHRGSIRGGARGMTTSGDLAALLGAASVVRAHADIRDWADPHATLAAWSTGPWAAEAAAGDPGLFGMPDRPYTDATRQWLDLDRDRAREERGSYLIVKDGPRWWSGAESGTEPESTV